MKVTVRAGAPGSKSGASGVQCQPGLGLSLPSGRGHGDFFGATRGGL